MPAPNGPSGKIGSASYMRAIMPELVRGLVAGAAIGACVAVARGTMAYKKSAGRPLEGHASKRIAGDAALSEQLTFLGAFADAAPDVYEDLVRAFDQLLAIYAVVAGRSVPTTGNVVYRTEMLQQTIERITAVYGGRIEAWHPRDVERLHAKNMLEIEAALDVLREIALNYLYNVRMDYALHRPTV